MAQFAIALAVNIAVTVALNALFSEDLEREGPRRSDLKITTASYGQPVSILFGTERTRGNIIWGLPIEERATRQHESGKGGVMGGSDSSTIDYTYFVTFSLSLGVHGADGVLRIWADGKLIYDITQPSLTRKSGVKFKFLPGGITQAPEALESADKGAANTPAYRHLTRLVFEDLPLADYGNRIPNLTVEYATSTATITPFTALNEPAGLNVPGGAGGGDTSRMIYDPNTNRYVSLKNQANGLWIADLESQEVLHVLSGAGGLVDATYNSGLLFVQLGTNNREPILTFDAVTGKLLNSFGDSGPIPTADTVNGPGNFGSWSAMRVFSDYGKSQVYLLHLNSFSEVGAIYAAFNTFSSSFEAFMPSVISSGDGFVAVDEEQALAYTIVQDGTDIEVTTLHLRLVPDFLTGGSHKDVADQHSLFVDATSQTIMATGSPGDPFETSGGPVGWALHRPTGYLLISNGGWTVLLDPSTQTVLANRAISFSGRNILIDSDTWAFTEGTSVNGTIRLIDVLTLQDVEIVDIGDVGFVAGNESAHHQSNIWESKNESIIFSRVGSGSTAPVDERVVRVYMGRKSGVGEPLSAVVTSLVTEHLSVETGGLSASDLDVTELASTTVEGYVINKQTTIRNAIEPLRKAFFFDGVSSDWKIKFSLRGGAPVVTIPENDIGKLTEGRHVEEVRVQEEELPTRLSIRYTNRAQDYNTDVEFAKRVVKPTKVVFTSSEMTFDVPVAFDTATIPKQIAEKWLYTMWNERTSIETILPWEYIALDPTDLIDVTLFGETIRLRIGEIDNAVDLAMTMKMVRQDSFTFGSTVGANLETGLIRKPIPSTLPTKLIFLDAPLLRVDDLTLGNTSTAYIAVGGYDNAWPGATVYRSINNASYTPTVTVTAEAAWGAVTVAPGTWRGRDNRFQEVVDGGTMTIVPLRRGTAWSSATELEILNGSNGFAVVTAGGVEIIQFETAVPNADGTITLNRLLRGRAGTEDITEAGGPDVGDEIVLLSGENTSLANQRLALADINQDRFYRGVTISTSLENAESLSFKYTGRDLQPYSLHSLAAGTDGIGGLDVAWERRTRINGALLDGTGEVPDNETLEKYQITLNTAAAGDYGIKDVQDAKSVNYTASEIAVGGVGSGLAESLFPGTPQGDFETDPLSGDYVETETGGTWLAVASLGAVGEMSSGPPSVSINSNFLGFTKLNTSDVESSIAITKDIVLDFGIARADLTRSTLVVSGWVASERSVDEVRIDVALLDANGGVIQEVTTSDFVVTPATTDITTQGDWALVGTDGSLTVQNGRGLSLSLGQKGATSIRVKLVGRKFGTTFSTAHLGFDELKVAVLTYPADLTVTARQLSSASATIKSPPTSIGV